MPFFKKTAADGNAAETKQYDAKEAFLRACSFCAYQERSPAEVLERLREWQVRGEDAAWVVNRLQEENFLDEARFARSFAGGKFRVKRWGRVKIRHELRLHGLSEPLVRLGLQEINEADYRRTLLDLLAKKNAALRDEDPIARRQKLIRFGLAKGYENELVWQAAGDF